MVGHQRIIALVVGELEGHASGRGGSVIVGDSGGLDPSGRVGMTKKVEMTKRYISLWLALGKAEWDGMTKGNSFYAFYN